jgi:hypothetical protein
MNGESATTPPNRRVNLPVKAARALRLPERTLLHTVACKPRSARPAAERERSTDIEGLS